MQIMGEKKFKKNLYPAWKKEKVLTRIWTVNWKFDSVWISYRLTHYKAREISTGLCEKK